MIYPVTAITQCFIYLLTRLVRLIYLAAAVSPKLPTDPQILGHCLKADRLKARAPNRAGSFKQTQYLKCTSQAPNSFSKQGMYATATHNIIGAFALATHLIKLLILSALIHPKNFLHSIPRLLPCVRLSQFFLNSLGAYLCCSSEFIMNKAISDHEIRWVTLDKCAELVGLTKDSLNALRVRGILRMDIHWKKRQGRIYIDLVAFQRWVDVGA